MNADEIRREFLRFFKERDHVVVPSSSLIPIDPTLLLTNAGMVQFKPYFLGDEAAPYRRATTAQKAFRTADIDIVGTTSRHLTFFEMLGNFSFGDYFKEKAIPWAYDFVTERLGVDPDRLWFTVYETDDEAEQIWIDAAGVAPERVQRGGKDNFWQMGVAGPCGPCSEIFVDQGPERGEGGGPIGGSEDRYTEIWNLVFMQNVQDVPYHVVGDLPAKSIDTGMGLERVTEVLEHVPSVFETGLLRPIIESAERVTAIRYGTSAAHDVSLRILGDHARAVTFLIGDGVVPSNDGRGYVLRRVLRRAVRHAWTMGAQDTIIPTLVEATIEVMRGAYPELAAKRDLIVDLAEREEWSFRRTLAAGSDLLESETAAIGTGKPFPGAVAFKLHDTYGFPIEITEELVAESGGTVDRAAFDALMEEQRARARAAWKGAKASDAAGSYRVLLDKVGPTEFVGYETEETTALLLSLVRGGENVERVEEGDEVEVFLDRTPFYAESGGQVGDAGIIVTVSGKLRVTDTQFPLPGLNGHRARVESGFVQVGQDATASIDSSRRESIRKSHTGTHVLHYALRDVLGAHVHQAGSLVEAGRLRFDFSHFAAPTSEEIREVERLANRRIVENAGVHSFETSKREAEKLGALAFFGDKYGERVRVVEVGDFSRELCGGTHVRTAGQIGPLVIVGEGSIGSNMRRVEALSGADAYSRVLGWRRELEEAAAVLKTQPGELTGAVTAMAQRVHDMEARLAAYEDRERSGTSVRLVEEAERIGSGRMVATVVGESSPDDLRSLAMAVRDRLGGGVVVLGAVHDGKGSLVCTVSRDLVAAGVSAGELIGGPARLLGGGGGRDPELAQAGGPHGTEIEEAIEAARAAVRAALEGR